MTDTDTDVKLGLGGGYIVLLHAFIFTGPELLLYWPSGFMRVYVFIISGGSDISYLSDIVYLSSSR